MNFLRACGPGTNLPRKRALVRLSRSLFSTVDGTEKPTVGLIGLGNMGAGMAMNLVLKGFSVVAHDYDTVRSRRLRDEAEKKSPGSMELVQCASSPAEVAQNSDVILLSIANQTATQDVVFGRRGLLEHGAAQRVRAVADLGTVSLGFSQRCHRAFAKFGVGFLDAPVSGGPEGAAAGTLSVMVGGEPAAFARARPALEAIGTNVVHLGKAGNGTITKMINQMLVGAHIVAAGEAYAMARGLGLDAGDVRRMRAVLERSWAASAMLERSLNLYLAADEEEEGAAAAGAGGAGGAAAAARARAALRDSRAPIRNLAKDFAIVEAAALGSGLRLPATALVAGLYSAAAAAGLQEADLCMVKEVFAAEPAAAAAGGGGGDGGGGGR